MTSRLVAVGRVDAGYRTVYIQYATTEPLWSPQWSGEEPTVDDDLLHKQRAEDALAAS